MSGVTAIGESWYEVHAGSRLDMDETSDGKLLEGKRALITGGLGFIGSNLAERLVEAGSQVTVVDSMIPQFGGNLFNVHGFEDRLNVQICDVRDREAMEYHLRGQDMLFNLAGQTSHLDSMENPEEDLEINCRAQLSILEACRKVNPAVRIIFTSTRQLYGRPQYLPVDEAHAVNPIDVNGINKWAGEAYHLLYATVYGLPSTVLRLTNTYGPRMRVKDARQTFLGIWIRRLLSGETIEIYGDGTQRRDYNYVDDVVGAMLLCLREPSSVGRVYNLGSEEVLSLRETADIMVELNGSGAGRLIPWPPDRKKIDIGDYYASYARIAKELGWRPATDFRTGVKKTLEYYRRHLARYL